MSIRALGHTESVLRALIDGPVPARVTLVWNLCSLLESLWMPIQEVLRSSNSQLKQSRGRSGRGGLNSFHPIVNTFVEPYFSAKRRCAREVKTNIHLHKIYLWDLFKN